jgi:hypothetical protein
VTCSIGNGRGAVGGYQHLLGNRRWRDITFFRRFPVAAFTVLRNTCLPVALPHLCGFRYPTRLAYHYYY